MTREKIFEAAFITIADALEWGSDRDRGADFAMFVEGVDAMTRKLLDSLPENTHSCNCVSCKSE